MPRFDKKYPRLVLRKYRPPRGPMQIYNLAYFLERLPHLWEVVYVRYPLAKPVTQKSGTRDEMLRHIDSTIRYWDAVRVAKERAKGGVRRG